MTIVYLKGIYMPFFPTTIPAQEEDRKSRVYFQTCFPLSPGIFIFKQYYLWFCFSEIWD